MTEEDQRINDVDEIQKSIAIAIENAQRIHKTVLLLHDRSEKEPAKAEEEEEKPTGDVGIEIKEALIRLRYAQERTLAALTGFIGLA